MVDVRTGLKQQLQYLSAPTERRHGKGRVARLLDTETMPSIEARVNTNGSNTP